MRTLSVFTLLAGFAVSVGAADRTSSAALDLLSAQYPFVNYNPERVDAHTEGTFCLNCPSVGALKAKQLPQQSREILERANAQVGAGI